MRLAQVADHWKKAVEAERRFRLTRLVAQQKGPISQTDVELANGIVVVCGLNGVGKTTTLRLLERALAGSGAGPLRPGLIGTGHFKVEVALDGATTTADLSDASVCMTKAVDGFDSCQRILRLARQEHFEDLIAAAGERDFTPGELADAAYVIGKRYDRVRVSEVEETDAGHGIGGDVDGGDLEADLTTLPFFTATVDGAEYDSTAMGLGELGALAALWSIWHAEPATVLLVEEPETFLSARASAALMDVVARSVARRRMYAVVTTHSPAVLTRVPQDHVLVLARVVDGYKLERSQSRAQLEFLLGSPIGQARLILTEDPTARVFTQELMARRSTLWTQSIEVLECHGEDPVRDICKKLVRARQLAVVGVLDGDQQLDGELHWPIALLPGPENPDYKLRSAAESNMGAFADALARSPEVVAAAVEPFAGSDEHDWFHHVANALTLEKDQVVRAAVECYLADPGNGPAAEDFARSITEALSQ